MNKILRYFCLGEVLGAPFEFREDRDPPQYETWIREIVDAPLDHWKDPLTAHTKDRLVSKTGDDVYFLLALARHVGQHRLINPHRLCDDFEEEVTRNNLWGLGGSSYEWYQNCLKRLPYAQRAAPDGMAGAAPVTRSIVIGLQKDIALDDLIDQSIRQSNVTHQDRRCECYALASAATIHHLLCAQQVSLSEVGAFLQPIIKEVFPTEQAVVEKFFTIGNNWTAQYSWLKEYGIETSTTQFPWLQERVRANPHKHPFFGGYAPVTFFWSLALAAKHEGRVLDAIYDTITHKGDTDTTAALIGGFCGAIKSEETADILIKRIDKYDEILAAETALEQQRT